MTTERQAIFLNAVPLIAVGVLYLAAAASLAPAAIRGRARVRGHALASLLVYPCIGTAALVFGVGVVERGEPITSRTWLVALGCLLAAAPAVAFFASFRTRSLVLFGSSPADAATAGNERRRQALEQAARAATRTEAARSIVDEATAAVDAEFGALLLVDDRGTAARAVIGRAHGADVEWMPGVRIDLVNETSGVASAYHDAAPFAVYDAANSVRVSRRLADRSGVKSVAFVPLLADRQVVAVLIVASLTAQRTFTPEQLADLQRLTADAAAILQRGQAAADLGTALERERIAGAIAQRLRSTQDLDAVVALAVEEVGRALQLDRCLLRLATPGEDGAGIVRAEWHAPHLSPVGREVAQRLPVSNLAARELRTIVVDDVASAFELDDAAPGGREILAKIGSRSVVAVPIIVFGRLVGVFAAHRTTADAWPARDVLLIESIAREVGFALDTAKLLEENDRRLARERSLLRVASVLAETLSLQETRNALAAVAVEAHGATSAALLSPLRGEGFRLVAANAVPAGADLAGAASADPALAVASTDRRLLAIRSLPDDVRFGPEWRALADASLRSALVVPVEEPRCDDAGLLVVFWDGERDHDEDELELARHLAAAGRAALERADLFEAERTSRSLSQQLSRMGALLATELDPAAVLDEVVAEAPGLVAADACAVWSVDGDELVVTVASGDDAGLALGARVAAATSLAGEVVQSRRQLVVDDVSRAAVTADDPFVAAGYAAYVGLPLVGPEGSAYGALTFYSRTRRPWRAEELEALQALAANTSAALSNAELYQRVALEKERSAAILENIADGIVAVDREGRVVLWNRAAEQITGVPAREAVGQPPERALGRALSGDGLVAVPRGDGDVWLSVTEAVMRDPAGGVAGRIYAFRDISADRLVEQMKTEFVSTVSHELRTPLTSIFGFAETLLREDVPFGEEERKVFLRYIASESKRLTSIVEALLNVARLDSGDLQVTVAPTEVAPILTQVVASAEEERGGNGHRFVVDIPPEPLAAEADVDKLRQVLAHLVENAVKYSPAGGTVIVAARRKSDRVEFAVADEGIGIPDAERERIFRKFYRASTAEDRDSARGTGTGLFIVRGLVNAMGGRIWVESTEGKGSRFAFELPVAGV